MKISYEVKIIPSMKECGSGMHIFSSCSAFEFGGDLPSLRGGGITALQYPPRPPRHFCAKPFERAVVRLTRTSLSVYRPADRAFHCELQWRDVREIRRQPTARGGSASVDFAFIGAGAILVLEVLDAAAADGIAAALEVLGAAESPRQALERPPAPPSDGRRSDALVRIRRREEEMREAIFFAPRARSHSAAPRGPSPAPQPQPPPEDVADILRLLDEEEARASRAMRTQEQRMHSLRRLQSPQGPQSPPQNVPGSLTQSLPQNVPGSAVVGDGVPQQRELPTPPLPQRPQENLQPVQKVACHSEKELERIASGGRDLFAPAPMPQFSNSAVSQPRKESVGRSEDAIGAAAQAQEGAMEQNRALNERRRAELECKAAENKEKLIVGGLSLTDALEHERQAYATKTVSDNTKDVEKEESVADARDLTGEATEKEGGPNTGESEQQKSSGVIYGDWKELRHSETGKVYYRNVVTKEALWKPPPEVLEIKKREGAKRGEAVDANGGSAAAGVDGSGGAGKKGALRVSGDWKEFRDAKSGRLYYVNSVTKQRTWKVEETAFASE